MINNMQTIRYSGVPDVMGKDDFMAGKLQFYERYPNRTITLEGVAFQV